MLEESKKDEKERVWDVSLEVYHVLIQLGLKEKQGHLKKVVDLHENQTYSIISTQP